jgi:hypothetical protein
MANCVGQELQNYKRRLEMLYYGGEQFEKIKIESSPFLSAMQTASHLTQGFGESHFTLNHMFGEQLKKRDSLESDGNPLPSLISANVNKEYIKAHWLAKGIEYTDKL